jgi:hypothetical protein
MFDIIGKMLKERFENNMEELRKAACTVVDRVDRTPRQTMLAVLNAQSSASAGAIEHGPQIEACMLLMLEAFIHIMTTEDMDADAFREKMKAQIDIMVKESTESVGKKFDAAHVRASADFSSLMASMSRGGSA